MDAACTALRASEYGSREPEDAAAQGDDDVSADQRSAMTEAIDVARTASRAGAREVAVISLEARDEMPAHDFEIEEAEHEGITFVPRRGPARIEVTDDRVAGTRRSACDRCSTPVLLAGWATWFVPCERELPALDALADSPAAEGVEIVAVDVDRADVSDDDPAAMLTRLDVDLSAWRDTDQTFLAAYEGTMMPHSGLLDRDGEVAASWTGSSNPAGDDFLAVIADVSG